MTDNEKVYNDRAKLVALQRQLYKVKYLLPDLKLEENTAFSHFEDIKTSKNIDYSHSYIMLSNSQVYKTYSIVGLLSISDKPLNYKILDLSYLLDIWYNRDSTLFSKTEIISCDVLIIKGNILGGIKEYVQSALIDLVNTRNTYNKVTWLYIKTDNQNGFMKEYKNVVKAYNNIYKSKY